MADKFRTGNDALTGVVYYQVPLPRASWFWAEVLDVLTDMADSDNWTEGGSVSIDDAIQAALSMCEGFKQRMIGEIITYVTATAPEGTLPCDGSTHLRVDYPDLYSRLSAPYIVDAEHFTSPDLRGRAPIAAGSGSGLSPRSLGDFGGTEQHTLDIGEIPVHNHSEIGAIAVFINGGLEAPASSAIPSAGVTGSTGSGLPHNNMMPFYAVNFAVVAQ